MQKGMSSANENSEFRKVNPVMEKTISTLKDKSSGIIPALKILEVGYNEMKEHIDPSASILPQSTIATDILKGLAKLEKIIVDRTMNEAEITANDTVSKSQGNSKRKELKKKAHGGEFDSKIKKISMKYRTHTTDDGEFIKITKSSQNKSKKVKQLSERQLKTVVKQLEVPMQEYVYIQ